MWGALLGVEHRVVDVPDPVHSGSAVADLWSGARGPGARAKVLVGQSRPDEMERVAGEVAALLAAGSDNVAVVLPGAGAAHARLARSLDSRGIAFADLIGACGAAPIETGIQVAIADFYAGGCRLEELLALWPLLAALNLVRIPHGAAREVCRALFDDSQCHSVEPHAAALAASERADRREVGRVAALLLPAWPAALTLRDALDRFEAARDRFGAGPPTGWAALTEFARRASEPLPAGAILEAIRSFLPAKAPLEAARPGSGFAHVTLTTARRAVGIAWSDVIFAASNNGVWPVRREASCWLDDEARSGLNASSRFSVGLATAEAREALERRMYSSIARDTLGQVAFSASLYDEEDPEARLEPNTWLERVIWDAGDLAPEGEAAGGFGSLAAGRRRDRAQQEPAPGALASWAGTWRRRRDPLAPFDEWFLAHGPGLRPERLSARLIEDGLEDPARLWFGAVLELERADWRPFARSRDKLVGTAVHRVLAQCLRGTPEGGAFFRMPPRGEAEARLEAALRALRARWPANRYWDSFHMDVAGSARDLLAQVFRLPAAPFAAVEAQIPDGASVAAGQAGSVPVRGRMDLVLSDRPSWEGAEVRIVDYKTGGDERLSATRMASKGASLQLGVYLEAARSLGASGSVWMLKPAQEPSGIGSGELAGALARLELLGRILAGGVYGALTPDRDEYAVRFEWPLACAPISNAVLRSKFERTFGEHAGLGDPGDE
jgi:RecB family exonuclease